MNRNLRARANRGFTVIELVVVVTVIGLLAVMAVGAYNKVVNDAKTTKSLALVNTLSTAKSLFVGDPERRADDDNADLMAGPDTQFALIAPYIRINGAIPTSEADLLAISGFPATALPLRLGQWMIARLAVQIHDTAPTVARVPLRLSPASRGLPLSV